MEILDLSTMSIRDVEDRIKHYENKENFYNEMMLNVFEKTQPKGVQPKYDVVQGSPLRVDKFLCYAIECEEPLYKEYETKRNEAHDTVVALTEYVEKELKSIGQYDPIVQSVVILKEKDGLTLEEIGDRLGYCSRHISRLYSEYKNKRCPWNVVVWHDIIKIGNL